VDLDGLARSCIAQPVSYSGTGALGPAFAPPHQARSNLSLGCCVSRRAQPTIPDIDNPRPWLQPWEPTLTPPSAPAASPPVTEFSSSATYAAIRSGTGRGPRPGAGLAFPGSHLLPRAGSAKHDLEPFGAGWPGGGSWHGGFDAPTHEQSASDVSVSYEPGCLVGMFPYSKPIQRAPSRAALVRWKLLRDPLPREVDVDEFRFVDSVRRRDPQLSCDLVPLPRAPRKPAHDDHHDERKQPEQYFACHRSTPRFTHCKVRMALLMLRRRPAANYRGACGGSQIRGRRSSGSGCRQACARRSL
jgi:hypothetical protein